MTNVVACSKCGRPIPANAGADLCPSCAGGQATRNFDKSPEGVAPSTMAAESYATADFVESRPGAADGAPPMVPGYDLLEMIGRGGMGMVWKARQHGVDRLVAVKLILEEKASGRARQRFELEAKALARLQHPNIVQIFEVGDTPSGPFFSMEYVAGGSLAQRLGEGELSAAEAARLTETMAEAIEAAHRAGVLHRDLKPSNVLLFMNKANAPVPKISDFGLAKTIEAEEGQTPTGAVLGTLNYMAPEQASGQSKDVGPAADVYGLGATLYELLTGRPPFRGADTLVQVLTKEPEPPGRIRRGVPRVLEAICLKCLEKDPKRRYATAASLAEDLARWRRGESTLARPQSRAKRAWRFVRRHPVGIMAAAAAIIAVAAAIIAIPRLDPDYELKKIQRKLARGESVTLVGEKGLPKWWRWEDGATPFATSTDTPCAFQAENESSLVLLPAGTAPAEFSLQAEIRHDSSTKQGSEVGIFFFRQSRQFTGSRSAACWQQMTFCDWPLASPKDPAKTLPSAINFGPRAILRIPDEKPMDLPTRSVANSLFEGVGMFSSRPWRTLYVEVTAAGIECWTSVNGRPKRPLRPGLISADTLRATTQQMQKDLLARGKIPDLWEEGEMSRGSLGLYVSHGQGSFRNVVIKPLQP